MLVFSSCVEFLGDSMQELKIMDLFDVSVLQGIQDSFSALTGMASLIADDKGIPVTNGSNFSQLCMELTRKSELGCKRCEKCDKDGALNALKEGEASVYRCHMGLVDFAAPIMVEGNFIGSIIGGQVSTEPLEEEKIRFVARELGIDEDAYVEAARKIVVIDEYQIKKSAQYLGRLAEIISKIAYDNYVALANSKRLERAARAQTAFIIDMNADIKVAMKELLKNIKEALDSDDTEEIKKVMSDLLVDGPQWLSNVEQTVEYARMTDGEIELNELEYNTRDMFDGVFSVLHKSYKMQNIIVTGSVEDDVPEELLGDMGRIVQSITRLVAAPAKVIGEGAISIHVSCKEKGYASVLHIEVTTKELVLSQDEVSMIREIIDDHAMRKINSNFREDDGVGISVVAFWVKQMSGKMQVESNNECGTSFIIELPQLRV